MYVEVSAKSGDNVGTIFNNTAQILLGFELTKMENEEQNKSVSANPTINLNKQQQEIKTGGGQPVKKCC